MSAPNAPVVIAALLKGDAALLAQIPADRMYPGDIPLSAALPALAYTNISDNDARTIRGNVLFESGRVQVTVAVNSYSAKERLIGLVRDACSNRRGLIAGIMVNDVQNAGIGPDLDNKDAGIFGRTIDFLVTSRPAN